MKKRWLGSLLAILIWQLGNTPAIATAIAAKESSGSGVIDFGPNVLILDPAMRNAQERIDRIFRKQERNEFGEQRYALLFKPGKYTLAVPVGFYTQVLGLGQSPDDVEIDGPVSSRATWNGGNATVNFWRAVENITVNTGGKTDTWAVSQGTQLRRDHFKGELHLWDRGWSSGGFLADCKIDGRVVSGSQQQWISRNAEWGHWNGEVWNMVFVGTEQAPEGRWPSHANTVVDQTPTVREKPFLVIDAAGRFSVRVPALRPSDSRGISWNDPASQGILISIDHFFIAHPGDSAATINTALASGNNLLFAPGLYQLDKSIRVTRPGTIVLGLGYPTLIPTTAEPAMVLSDVDGIEVGGFILDAGPSETPELLRIGDSVGTRSHAADPICLYDICARAGGASAGMTNCFVTINSNNVIGDNVWLWRADHGMGAAWDLNKVRNGLVVNGNDVTFYGLFVEHCQQYQTLWNGNGGRTYFYQSEMPYDPPSQAAWSHDGEPGYASYKVSDSVTTHQAWGMGIYSNFTAASVVCASAIETPSTPGIKMHNMTTVRLGGEPGSTITHVINGRGDAKTAAVTPMRVSE